MKVRTMLAAMLMVAMMAVPALAGVDWSGDVEVNTDLAGHSNGSDTTEMSMGGRVEVTAASKKENEDGMFVAGQGQIEIGIDGSPATADAWGQIGTPSFSFKLGYFEAEGLYSKGEDIYIAEAGGPGRYEANAALGRDSGGMALDFNVSDNMMIQIAAIYGNETQSGDYIEAEGTVVAADGSEWTLYDWESYSVPANKIGFRPLVKFSNETVTAKVGFDYLMLTPQDSDADGESTTMGFGADLSASFGNMTVGVSAASKTDDGESWIDGSSGEEVQTTNASAYLTMAMGDNTLGFGGGYTTEDSNDNTEMYGFASYAMPLPVEGAALKFGASFASAEVGDHEPTAFGFRVRLNYDF